jgi:serine/threonine-protein kinase
VRLESLPGSVLDQKYRIDRQLGKGAMGAVFQAIHLGTTRTVALKVIVPNLAQNVEFSQRFKREAEASGRLRHVNVVNVTDFGVTHVGDDELAYLVMEYLDGETLSSYLKKEPRPSFNFILDVIDQSAMALDAAHAAGIVHRDLKPSNIWLEPNHRGGFNVKVLDFGIAKVAGSVEAMRQAVAVRPDEETMMMAMMEPSPTLALASTPSSLQTTVGTLLGTPSYMAPEQCQTLAVEGSADIYSLAVIAYEMLCSRLPFQADDLQQLIQMQVQTTPQSPNDRDKTVPATLSQIVMSGLSKDPERRPPTASAFAARMRAVAEGEFALLRQAKDAAHTHTNCFLPLLFLCLATVIVGVIPVQLAAHWAYDAKLAPSAVLGPMIGIAELGLVLFAFQFYKAGCMLVLQDAAENGQFRPRIGSTLRRLIGASPTFLATQLRSTFDLRPAAFRDNLLWPVVWVKEGLGGRKAIERSRALCRTLRGAAAGLMIRQYGPPMFGITVLPAAMAMAGVEVLSLAAREIVQGSPQGWLFLFYPLMFGGMLLNYGAAFSFLYWSALRCQGESEEVSLPAAARDEGRNSGIRTSTLVWVGLPLILLTLVVLRAMSHDEGVLLVKALNEGRGTAVLKYLSGGLPVDYRETGQETPLFEAARRGQRKLAEALLERGANVNARSKSGTTALMTAVSHAQYDMARLLVEHGAAVNQTTTEGRTALMIAAMSGNQELVRLLMQRGADPGIVDAQRKTALVYAREENHGEIAEMLQGALSGRAR